MKSHWDQNIALNPQSVEADKNFFKVYSHYSLVEGAP